MKKIFLFILLTAFVFTSCKQNYGKEVSQDGHTLYYLEPVTEGEAQKVLAWLHEINHNFGEPPVPFQLSKENDKVIFKYPVQNEGAENEDGNVNYITSFSKRLSLQVFAGKPVEVHLTNEDLKTKKVISSNTR